MRPRESVRHTYQAQPWRRIPCRSQDLLHISRNQRSAWYVLFPQDYNAFAPGLYGNVAPERSRQLL